MKKGKRFKVSFEFEVEEEVDLSEYSLGEVLDIIPSSDIRGIEIKVIK